MSPRCRRRCARPGRGFPANRYTSGMDAKSEARIAAARGHEPCPNCGSADVAWWGRRWHESLRRAIANIIEFPFRWSYAQSRTPRLDVAREGAWHQRIDANRHWRLREAFDARVAAMDPRIWECRACGKRGETYPEYASIVSEYSGDLAELERNLPYGSRPDQPLGRGEPNRNPIPGTDEINDTLTRG